MYERVIEFFRDKRRAYKQCFGSAAGEEVLQDLSEFCRANTSTFDADPRMHAVLEGRREVWLRIQEYLHLTPDQLATLKVRAIQQRTETNG
jgi:hypothetical protein